MTRYETKTIVSVPNWAELLGKTQTSITTATNAYTRVPLIYRATRIRCNSLLQVPRRILAGEDTEVEWSDLFEIDLDRWLWQTQAALLLAGASFTFKERVGRNVKALRWLNPFTMRVQWDKEQQRRLYFQQTDSARYPASGYWTDDDILFIREFSPSDDVGIGTSAAQVAMQSASLSYALTYFAANFFENGAMPVTTVSVIGAMQKAERERIEGFFKRALSGVAQSFRVLALNQDVKVQTTQNPLKDLATPELTEQARKDVARAFELPVTLLDSDETYATASVHQRTYYADTVIPTAKMIASALNEGLFAASRYRLEFDQNEMDIFQEDEAQRADALATLAATIQNTSDPDVLRASMALLGYDIPEELEPLLFKKREPQPQPTLGAAEGDAENVSAAASGETAKNAERKLFRAFVKKHGAERASRFAFHHLDAGEQAELKKKSARKSIETNAQQFRARLVEMVNRAWNEQGGRITGDMRRMVSQYVEDAFFEGLLDGGATPDQMSAQDRALLAELTDEQLAYIAQFSRDVQDAGSDTVQQAAIQRRIELWSESMVRIGNRGFTQAAATRKERVIWNTAHDDLTCPICAPLNGKIVRAGEPFAAGIYNAPAHPNCRCQTAVYRD